VTVATMASLETPVRHRKEYVGTIVGRALREAGWR
jgi:hypothetical protein